LHGASVIWSHALIGIIDAYLRAKSTADRLRLVLIGRNGRKKKGGES
jgi:hypothetical protein